MAVGLYDLTNRALVRRRTVELNVAGALTNIPELAGENIADLLLLNDHDLSYGKIRFDDRSFTTLTKHLGAIQDPLSRALCWAAMWDMMRDGELAAREYVPMAINALASEFDIVVVIETLKQLEAAVEIYSADANRPKLREVLANGLESLLANTDPGSDLQLQYARSFASAAATPTQYARIRDLLNGDLNGLVVDTDMRWYLMGCLVERGLATNAEIDAELQRDNTASGQRYAAFARAAFPNAAVKAKAFNAASKEKLSNHIQLSTIHGFQRPLHRDFIRVYVDRYFEMVLDVWNAETYEIAKNVAIGLYPTYVISQATLDATEKWLAGTGKNAPIGLRRIMFENRDAMGRALEAKTKDAQKENG